MPSVIDFVRRQSWRLDGNSKPLRALVALTTLTAVCAALGWKNETIALYLGVIASAIGETDDSARGRVRALVVMLAFFAAAAYAVKAIIGLPALFIVAVALGAFCLTMMGALQARYKAIGYATLVLAMYATIGIDGQPAGSPGRAHEPLLLLTGAAWYGLLSIAASAAFPARPVQDQLVKLFSVLGTYLGYKASLFEPLRGVDVDRKRVSLAQLNAAVVAELNDTKESILRRVGPARTNGPLARYQGLYLIAQDVHERASSSHDDYNALADAFFHSDLLYRCQRVLMLQSNACRRLGDSIERREPFVVGTDTLQALNELRSAIDHQRAQTADARRQALLPSLEALADNLSALDAQFAGASDPSALPGRSDMGLSDTSPHSLREMAARVRRQLSTGSVLFRHALRLAIALSAGYAVTWLIHPAQGYWIMLTTLFVCQRNYGDTVARLSQRTAGTVLGVISGWALLQLFPQAPVQNMLAVAAGVIFFSTRVSRYVVATAAITVLVLMSFNQVGHGEVLIVPRLLDTALGCLIAWAAVLLVFPHWQSRRFTELTAATLRGHAAYLLEITRQYKEGARDDQAYRVARRAAHDADAALATAVVDMYREPDRMRPNAGTALRMLIQSHTLLNYLSALGAHRAALPESATQAALAAQSAAAARALRELADSLTRAPAAAATPREARPPLSAEAAPLAATDPGTRLIATEIALVWRQIDSLDQLAREWIALEETPAPPRPAADPTLPA